MIRAALISHTGYKTLSPTESEIRNKTIATRGQTMLFNLKRIRLIGCVIEVDFFLVSKVFLTVLE